MGKNKKKAKRAKVSSLFTPRDVQRMKDVLKGKVVTKVDKKKDYK